MTCTYLAKNMYISIIRNTVQYTPLKFSLTNAFLGSNTKGSHLRLLTTVCLHYELTVHNYLFQSKNNVPGDCM